MRRTRKRRICVPLAALLVAAGLAVAAAGCRQSDAARSQQVAGHEAHARGELAPRVCERIVSLAPSATEALFAVGLGDRVVGVTRYCDYPPEARSRTDVGGYYDPNYEAILELEPDLVVILPEHDKTAKDLARLRLPTLELDHRGVEEILRSLLKLGEACGNGDQARALVSDLEARIETVRGRRSEGPRPRVLVTVGRDLGSGTLGQVHVAGRNSFYDELIELAGGENACQQTKVRFPAYTVEGILRLDPDVIVELLPDLASMGLEREEVLDVWREELPEIQAVRSGRLHVLTDACAVIPGPRFPLVVERLAGLLHPEGGEASR